MQKNSLNNFIYAVQNEWQGFTPQSVLRVRELLQQLAKASSDEHWLAAIHVARPASLELYSDPKHGFKLLVHTETKGMYRAPHNHGDGWVLYAIQAGEMAMATYRQLAAPNAELQLYCRGAELMQAGDCKAFLPGDIHDTRCLSEYLIQFRFTSCDLQLEKQAGRLQQFAATNLVQQL